jgi:hypothetical protein
MSSVEYAKLNNHFGAFPTIRHLLCPARAISSLAPSNPTPQGPVRSHNEAGCPRDAELLGEGSILRNAGLPLGIGHVCASRRLASKPTRIVEA